MKSIKRYLVILALGFFSDVCAHELDHELDREVNNDDQGEQISVDDEQQEAQDQERAYWEQELRKVREQAEQEARNEEARQEEGYTEAEPVQQEVQISFSDTTTKERKKQTSKQKWKEIKEREDAEHQRLERQLKKLARMDEQAIKEKKRRGTQEYNGYEQRDRNVEKESYQEPLYNTETEREKKIREREKAQYTSLNRKIKDMHQDETVQLVKQKNREIRQMKIDLEHSAGAFADLYKSASWPFYALYYPTKTFITLTGDYQYASDAYGPDGDSEGIEQLVLGNGCIRLRDISLASSLLAQGLVKFNSATVPAGPCVPTAGCPAPTPVQICVPDKIGEGLLNLANNNLFFKGREDRFELSFDIARYVFRQDVSIGMQIPVVYNHHRLQASIITTDQVGPNAGNNATIAPVLLNSLFQAKGITELGGSAGGIGDITLFARVDVNIPKFIDKLVTGIEVQAPTGKKATTRKLWAPELGNGGFWEVGLFGAVQFNYKPYLNAHIFTQVALSASANLKRRVPKLITSPTTGNFPNLGQFMALGNHVQLIDQKTEMATSIAANAIPFSAFDTCIPAVADNIACVTITPGPEFTIKIGNMFEKFISRRGFLDLYYDFRIKAHDRVRGLPSNLWNIGLLETRTRQIAHIIGTEYAYQFDRDTRFRAGIAYTFAGKNVAQTLEVSSALNYSF